MDPQVLTDVDRELGVAQPTLLILGRPTCDDCQAYYAQLATWSPPVEMEVLTLNLRAPEGAAFRKRHSWVEHIDSVPFNVLYVNNEPVDQWTGGDLVRLMSGLNALEA